MIWFWPPPLSFSSHVHLQNLVLIRWSELGFRVLSQVHLGQGSGFKGSVSGSSGSNLHPCLSPPMPMFENWYWSGGLGQGLRVLTQVDLVNFLVSALKCWWLSEKEVMKHCGSLCRLLEGGHQKAMSNMKHATALLKAFQKTPQIRCFRAPPFSVQTHSKTSHLQKTIDSHFLSSLLKVHNFSQWHQVVILCDFFRQQQFVPRLAFSLCTCHQRKMWL